MVKIRPAQPADAEAIARVHVDTWRTAYTGIVPDEHLEGLSYERSAQGWRRAIRDQGSRGFLFVAEDDEDGIVGFAGGGPLREGLPGHPDYQGEVYAIYVRAEHQRQGIGSRLMGQAFQWLVDRGLGTVVVWVLEANPSRRFYEALGGREVARQTIAVAGVELPEVAYGWPDASSLAQAPTQPSDGASIG